MQHMQFGGTSTSLQMQVSVHHADYTIAALMLMSFCNLLQDAGLANYTKFHDPSPKSPG